MNTNHNQPAPAGRQAHARLSEQEMRALGLTQVAYIRRVTDGTDFSFAIFAADGTPLGMQPNLTKAHGLILQNDLVPVALH